MLLSLLAAAAVQAAAAPPPQKTLSPEIQRQLACPAEIKRMPIPTGGAQVKGALHSLAAEPDAHLILPVARNYCEPNDVVRYFVSSKEAPKKAQEPTSNSLRAPTSP